MTKLLLAVVLAANFTTYNFDRGPLPRIEAVTDLGPVLELIVHCQSGTAIITYSKIERVYCGPAGGCDPDHRAIIDRSCN
jgi:hypothetical protein